MHYILLFRRYYNLGRKLLHFALLLHFVSKVIAFCVTITFVLVITFCGVTHPVAHSVQADCSAELWPKMFEKIFDAS